MLTNQHLDAMIQLSYKEDIMIDRFQAFVSGITICYKYIQKIKTMEMTEFGLKGTHVMCVFYIYHSEEKLTAAQLCQLCAEDKAAISRTLVTLQEKGFVESGEKKYRAHLTLTKSGVELAKKINSLIEQWVGLGGDGLNEEERMVFYRSLDIISANLREKLTKEKN